MVFDLPAVSGGALTILDMHHKKAIEDKENEYIFVVSLPVFKHAFNVTVLNFPWIKKSWFHRYYFDKLRAKRLVNQYNPDKIISLQNIMIGGTEIPQEIYVHQSLPFVKHKFNLFTYPKLWVNQNIISRMIIKSVKKAQMVTVQTEWMKNAIIARCGVNAQKVSVVPPQLTVEIAEYCKDGAAEFFYPAAPFAYKNHITIIKALILLKKQNIKPQVTFTLDGSENRLARRLKELSQKNGLNVIFSGSMPYETVLRVYSKSVLLFPSFVESFPLPLLEARMSNCPIICTNEPFCKEICNRYDKTVYFKYNNYGELADKMKEVL
jgi:glycosyltransferase involved in cell wall biosynthesis